MLSRPQVPKRDCVGIVGAEVEVGGVGVGGRDVRAFEEATVAIKHYVHGFTLNFSNVAAPGPAGGRSSIRKPPSSASARMAPLAIKWAT